MDTPTGKAVDQAHAELLKFVGKAGLLLDYLGEIPTARDCAECRPNAKGWWTPIENGWKCPCEAPFDAETCGNFLNESAPFRNAAHGLFFFRILGELDAARYGGLYAEMAPAKARKCA